MEPRQLGVEEELLLIDPRTRRAAPRSNEVVGDRAERMGGSGSATDDLSQELLLHQVETMTAPATSRDALREQIVAARRTAGLAAAEQGLGVVATGAVPLPGPHHRVTPDERYEDLITRFGDVARDAGTCGMHVHVDIDGDDEGVAVIDRVGTWVPLLLAISANSPYAEGRDTGYASWRAQVWSRWPTAGATETFGSPARYHEVVEQLIELGAARDTGNIYFDVRLATDQPTVELRVADVCTDVDDALLIAVLARALVDTAARSASAGAQIPTARVELKRAAFWSASRYGVEGDLVHPVSMERLAAGDLGRVLLDHLGASLEAAGDLSWVTERLADLGPGGAERQRLCHRREGSVDAVVDDLLARTEASWRE